MKTDHRSLINDRLRLISRECFMYILSLSLEEIEHILENSQSCKQRQTHCVYSIFNEREWSCLTKCPTRFSFIFFRSDSINAFICIIDCSTNLWIWSLALNTPQAKKKRFSRHHEIKHVACWWHDLKSSSSSLSDDENQQVWALLSLTWHFH